MSVACKVDLLTSHLCLLATSLRKWHLGLMSWEYTPTYRGFDSFHGFYSGYSSYYDHSVSEGVTGHQFSFYDLRQNEEEDREAVTNREYGMFWERDRVLEVLSEQKQSESPFFLYIGWQSAHSPNEAPTKYVEQYDIPSIYDEVTDSLDAENRIYGQTQTEIMDESIGQIVDYLKANGMWKETLLVFASDNGGKFGRNDNYPLRGYKNSSFEGGIRTTAFVSGGVLEESRRGLFVSLSVS